MLAAMRRAVHHLGGEADCVSNAVDAARLVRSRHYDYVLLDFKVPGKSGIWFMEHAGVPADTKVVIMTRSAPAAAIEAMIERGVTGYVEKPFDIDALLKVLAGGGDATPAVPVELRIDHMPGPSADHSEGSSLVCFRHAVPA
jgi:DNA-binding NtrC family response regulator